MTFGVRAFHDGDAGIGRAEVDTDDFTHGGIPHLSSRPPSPEAARPMADELNDEAGSRPLAAAHRAAAHIRRGPKRRKTKDDRSRPFGRGRPAQPCCIPAMGAGAAP